MGTHYFINGQRFRRRNWIRLMPGEENRLGRFGTATVVRPVEQPLVTRTPDFGRALAGGVRGDDGKPIPYLNVPSVADGGEEVVSVVMCPWGYPKECVRAGRHNEAVIDRLELVRSPDGMWLWVLTLVHT